MSRNSAPSASVRIPAAELPLEELGRGELEDAGVVAVDREPNGPGLDVVDALGDRIGRAYGNVHGIRK